MDGHDFLPVSWLPEPARRPPLAWAVGRAERRSEVPAPEAGAAASSEAAGLRPTATGIPSAGAEVPAAVGADSQTRAAGTPPLGLFRKQTNCNSQSRYFFLP